MSILYVYDPNTMEYIGNRPAQVVGGKALTLSAVATTVAPPEDIPANCVAVWDGATWAVVVDHRQQVDAQGIPSGGMAYWLPDEGDDYTSPARYMDAPGPLPAGAVTTPPEQPAPTAKEMDATIRAERDRRIAATDYLLMPDYPISAERLAAVKTYRQALRDITVQDGFSWGGDVSSVPWPEIPTV